MTALLSTSALFIRMFQSKLPPIRVVLVVRAHVAKIRNCYRGAPFDVEARESWQKTEREKSVVSGAFYLVFRQYPGEISFIRCSPFSTLSVAFSLSLPHHLALFLSSQSVCLYDPVFRYRDRWWLLREWQRILCGLCKPRDLLPHYLPFVASI